MYVWDLYGIQFGKIIRLSFLSDLEKKLKLEICSRKAVMGTLVKEKDGGGGGWVS